MKDRQLNVLFRDKQFVTALIAVLFLVCIITASSILHMSEVSGSEETPTTYTQEQSAAEEIRDTEKNNPGEEITGEDETVKSGEETTQEEDITNEEGTTSEEIKPDEEETTPEPSVPEESIVPGYTNLGISSTTGSAFINVRSGPGTGYKKVGIMPAYAVCEILESTENGWYKITSGEVEGYVYAEYIITGAQANAVASVNVITVAVKFTEKETETTTEKETEAATEKETEKATEGESEKETEKETESTSKEFASGDQTVSQTVTELINYAMQFLGNPYVLGGNSLTNGTDCSGFTKLIFAEFGYTLSRIPKYQVSAGGEVELWEVKPGDLLFYEYNGEIGHVAIYIGDRKILHASTPEYGITIDNALYTTPACAVRVID